MTPPDRPEGPVPDVDALDELASTLVDGEATDADQARGAEPEVARRVAAFEAVARRVGQPVPPPDDRARDTAIGTALAAAGEPPVALAERRHRRRRQPAWLPAVGAVAAAALAVVGLGVFLTSLDGGDDADQAAESATTFAATAGDDAGADAAGDAETTAGAESSRSASELAVRPDLGEFGDEDALADAVRQLETARPAPTADEEGADGAGSVDQASECPDEVAAGGVVATARLAGRPIVIAVVADPDGSRRFEAFAVDTCELVASGEL